ncbi:MAG TPA: hypothetical protein VFX58_08180 [Chitinophagaceae bacterium]|nr:hypothetical protein [Chitinophagaceae bacterium]
MYIKRLLIVILLSLGLAWLLGYYFDSRYKKKWKWLVFDKAATALSPEPSYDILLLGNSRVYTGLNPYYIDSITGLNSYNLALDGSDEQEMKLLTTLYLQHHQAPHIVLVGLDNSMLVKYNILKERFAYLFYLEHDSVYDSMKRHGFPTALIRVFPFLKYSFFDEYNRASLFRPQPHLPVTGHNPYKGFINIFPGPVEPSTGPIINKTPFRALPTAKTINDTAALVLTQTVELLQANNCQIIFLFPPVRDRSAELTGRFLKFESFFINLAKSKNITMMRADTMELFSPGYFVDNGHLNVPGSVLLSQAVGNFIRDHMQPGSIPIKKETAR